MVKVIIAGASGRMGQRICRMVHQHPELELIGGVERHNSPSLGADMGEVAGIGSIGIKIEAGLKELVDKGDVLIDFTHHRASVEFACIGARHNLAMVIGTTGLSPEEINTITSLSEKGFPCVQAPNMAIGVNVLFKLVEKTANILGDNYDVEIVEAHHRLKKDAPSGTALKLGEMAAQGLGRDLEEVGVYDRHGLIGERTDQEIGIQTIRGGDIIGDHTVHFAGSGERLEITHRAQSRDNFARGAAAAAAWVKGKPNGMYTMFDVLGLNNF